MPIQDSCLPIYTLASLVFNSASTLLLDKRELQTPILQQRKTISVYGMKKDLLPYHATHST